MLNLSNWYDGYVSRVNETGSTPTEYYKKYIQELSNERFKIASNIVGVQFQNRDTLQYEDIDVRLTIPYKLRQQSNIRDDYREVLFQDNSFVIYLGELFQFNGFYWICIDTGRLETPTSSCQIQRCNNTLKFYDENGVYCETPCIAQSGNVYDVQQDKMVWIPSNTMKVFVKYDDIGRKIKSDRRFLMNDTPWRTGDVNAVKYVRNGQGYIEFFVTADVISSNDNRDLGVADYYTQSSNYILNILNGSNLQVHVGTPLLLNTQVTKAVNGNSTVVSPTPLILFTSSDITIATVDTVGNVTFLQTGNVRITAKLSMDNTIQRYIDLQVLSTQQNNYSLSIVGDSQPDIEVKLNSSKTYTAHLFNNGSEILNSLFDFVLTQGTTPSSAFVYTVLSDSQVKIQCKQYTYDLVLTVYLRSDHSIVQTKNIKLKGVI